MSGEPPAAAAPLSRLFKSSRGRVQLGSEILNRRRAPNSNSLVSPLFLELTLMLILCNLSALPSSSLSPILVFVFAANLLLWQKLCFIFSVLLFRSTPLRVLKLGSQSVSFGSREPEDKQNGGPRRRGGPVLMLHLQPGAAQMENINTCLVTHKKISGWHHWVNARTHPDSKHTLLLQWHTHTHTHGTLCFSDVSESSQTCF